MINKLIENWKLEKITKKQYKELNENIHYFIGTIYKNSNEQYNLTFETINELLFNQNTFNNLEYLEQNCLKYIGISENTKDFKHLKNENGKIIPCFEQKKGSFYKLDIGNNLYLVIHEYKDNSNTITLKIIDLSNKYNKI